MLSAKKAREIAEKTKKKNDKEAAEREKAHKIYIQKFKKDLEQRLPDILKEIEKDIKNSIRKKEKYVLYFCENRDSEELSYHESEVIIKAMSKLGYKAELKHYTHVKCGEEENASTTYHAEISW